MPGISLVCEPLARVPPSRSGSVLSPPWPGRRPLPLWTSSSRASSAGPCTATQVPTCRRMIRNHPRAPASLCRFQNTHGHALPCVNPRSLIVHATSDCQSRAPALVPYIDVTSFPHRCTSPDSVLSSFFSGCHDEKRRSQSAKV